MQRSLRDLGAEAADAVGSEEAAGRLLSPEAERPRGAPGQPKSLGTDAFAASGDFRVFRQWLDQAVA
jgi:hypothetical protein